MKYSITVIGTPRVFECTRYFELPNGNICLENPEISVPANCIPMYRPKRVEIPREHALIERIE